MDMGLRFNPLSENDKLRLRVCADASFAPTGDASHEGMCLIHGGTSEDTFQGNLIHWISNKQSLVTKSCEAELLALVSAAETSKILGLFNAEGMRSCNHMKVPQTTLHVCRYSTPLIPVSGVATFPSEESG
eukprot:584629-Amphidinium_carterae.2